MVTTPCTAPIAARISWIAVRSLGVSTLPGVAMGYERAGSVSEFPPTRVAGRGRGWYRGDCHVHSVYSNGAELTPEQLAAGAREAGLDFIATTEHNTSDAHGIWSPHAGDDLLVILGQEITTWTGHWLALGIDPGQVVDWRYRVRDNVIDRHLDQVHQAGGLCVAAHPHAPYASGDFMYPYHGFDVIEVWNGLWTSDRPWNADNEAALAEWGRSLAFPATRPCQICMTSSQWPSRTPATGIWHTRHVIAATATPAAEYCGRMRTSFQTTLN